MCPGLGKEGLCGWLHVLRGSWAPLLALLPSGEALDKSLLQSGPEVLHLLTDGVFLSTCCVLSAGACVNRMDTVSALGN